MNCILFGKVSTPAKTFILPDLIDEALHSLSVVLLVKQAVVVAGTSSFKQIHVDGMTHKMIAACGGFYNGAL